MLYCVSAEVRTISLIEAWSVTSIVFVPSSRCVPMSRPVNDTNFLGPVPSPVHCIARSST